MNRKLLLTTALLALTLGLMATPAFSMKAEEKHDRNFVAHLSGKLWTSHVNSSATYGPIATFAQGQAIFTVSKDGKEIQFMLIAANIQNITMTHIHIDDGAIPFGPIVVWLYPREAPGRLIPGRFDGILAKGTITAADLVGILKDMPLSVLIDKMENGFAYVVIHTQQHPPGEIRGFIH